MEADSAIKRFITWKDAYRTEVSLIDEQHRGILSFINQWFLEIQTDRASSLRPDRVWEKLDFLVGFCKGHIRFESEMLKRLTEDHGFSRDQYQEHMQDHRLFLENLMVPLVKAIRAESRSLSTLALESIINDGLFDVARWWSGHIRSPEQGEQPGPDHGYRLFLDRMNPGAKLDLLNRMILFMALHDNALWLKRISPAGPD